MKDLTYFSIVCFLALTDHHGKGWNETHPSYTMEKFSIIGNDEFAYASLDRENQERVLEYCKKWGLRVPEEIFKYEEGYNQLS